MGVYEEMRENATGEAGVQWRTADREEQRLRQTYEELANDNRYTDEYKAEQAWEAFNGAKDKISSGRQEAQKLLKREARDHERLSLPRPAGTSLIVTNPTTLLACQNEAARIRRRVERAESKAVGGVNRADILRGEYQRGLDVGGTEGLATIKGVVGAAEELGTDIHAVVNNLREPQHLEALERAQTAVQMAGVIAKRVPNPPFERPRNPRRLSSIFSESGANYGGNLWRR